LSVDDRVHAISEKALRPAVLATLLETLFASGSDLLILPIQDVFGWRDRINTPALVSDTNWCWRLPWPVDALQREPAALERVRFLRALAERWGRRELLAEDADDRGGRREDREA